MEYVRITICQLFETAMLPNQYTVYMLRRVVEDVLFFTGI